MANHPWVETKRRSARAKKKSKADEPPIFGDDEYAKSILGEKAGVNLPGRRKK